MNIHFPSQYRVVVIQLYVDNVVSLYFSHFISSKNYAVQLEKVTSRQFRDKGRQHSESYFQFPNWESPAWEKTKKEFGEGLNPIDKIESKNCLNYYWRRLRFIALYMAHNK